MHEGPENKQRPGEASDILGLTGQASYDWDIASDLLAFSSGFARLAELKDPSAILHGRAFERLVASNTGQSRRSAVFSGATGIRTGEPVHYQTVYAIGEEHVISGAPVWLEDTGAWFADDNGKPARAVGVVRVINERRKREDQLRRRSDHDDLTGLPNRRYLEFTIAQTLEKCSQEGTHAALLVVGIERMDQINDFYGFPAGDEVLKTAGEMLAKTLRSNDVIARFSGAKFAIMLHGISGSELYAAARRYLAVLSKSIIKTSGGPVALNATIGGCQLPRHARTASDAIAACFSASQQAARDKHSRIALFVPSNETRERSRADARLATKVVEMMEQGRFKLAYQPIVAAQSGKVAFHEALIRMENDDGRIIGAGDFLPLAERLGFIRTIDSRAVDLAMDTLCTYPDAHLSINVSHASAEDPDWLSRLMLRLQGVPGAAARLIVEITESHAASDLETAQKFVSILKGFGCRIAVDDFGAGYTSFANLRSLPVDIIKIDGSFAKDLITNRQNQVFIKSLLDLASAFQVQTVVEWVENAETAALLADWGVDFLQGHCFGAASIACPWSREAEPNIPVLAAAG